MTPEMIHGAAQALVVKIKAAGDELDRQRSALSAIQGVCDHRDKLDMGYDPRGRGTDHYKCNICLREWSE